MGFPTVGSARRFRSWAALLVVFGCLALISPVTRLAGAAIQRASAWAGPSSPNAAGGPVAQPERIRVVAPEFPPEAVKAGVTEAKVVLLAIIDTRGRPRQLRIALSSHPDLGFEAAAITAVKRWRYRPALQDGDPVAVYFYIEVGFKRPET